MHDRAYAVATGGFIVVALAALAITAYWLTGADQERRPYVVVSAYSVAGLAEGSEVLYRGVPAGRVRTIGIDPADPGQVLVGINIDAAIPVLESTFATLHQRGLTGVAQIELEQGDPAAARLPTSDDDPASIPLAPSLIDEVTEAGTQALEIFREIAGTLDEALNERNRERLASMTARLDGLLASVEGIAATLEAELPGTLAEATRAADAVADLAERTAVSMEEVDALIAELRSTAAVARELGSQLGSELTGNRLAGLDEALDGVDAAAAEIERLARDLGQQPERILRGGRPAAPGPGEE